LVGRISAPPNFKGVCVSIQPVTWDLIIPQRASLEEIFRFPYDGTGCSAFAQIYDSDRRRLKILDLTVTFLDRYEEWDPEDLTKIRSTVKVTATWEQTRAVVKDGYWDFLWVWPDGLRDYLIEGQAPVNLGITEEP
jgi:hypothetical protein